MSSRPAASGSSFGSARTPPPASAGMRAPLHNGLQELYGKMLARRPGGQGDANIQPRLNGQPMTTAVQPQLPLRTKMPFDSSVMYGKQK